MPSIFLVARATLAEVLDAVVAAADREGLAILSEGKSSVVVRKGSLALSIFLGIFVAYAHGEATVKELGGGEVRMKLEWGNPWWQGIFGPGRARGIMSKLVDRIEKEIESEGGAVVDRKDK